MGQYVQIQGAVKKFSDVTAVNGVSITVEQGEIFTLLGPSGCGKTTLLRMIAGFHSVDAGEILFASKVINNVPAYKRDIGMVFQSYAVFPHMTVRENVAYGLKAKKIPRADIKKKVEEALDLVQIASLASRKPSELSGGQQQRVALARAFIIEPSVLLMDEPLSNLDAKLRVQMRTVIKKIQRRLGITTIYVTHDQEEALAISDRIAVMKDGNIMQVGVPSEVYKRPDNLFVAGFVGTSNPIECTAVCTDTNAVLTVDNMEFKTRFRKPFNGKAVISIRPEQFKFSDTGLAGEIVISTFLGDFVEYEILLANGMTVLLNEYTKDSGFVRPDGEKIRVSFDLNRVGVYDSGSGELLTGWTT